MHTNDSSQVFKQSILRVMVIMLTSFALIACGGSSSPDGRGEPDEVGDTTGDVTGGDGSGTDDESGPTPSTLERNFPVSENGTLPTSLNQSFACIDELDEVFYELDFSPSGDVTIVESFTNLTYSISGNTLSIDVEPVLGPGVSYQHAYHLMAGDLMVGFVGAFTNGFESASLACVAARHEFSEPVPEPITIVCPSSGSENLGDNSFTSTTTNRFSLEPNHYAQRYFNSETFFSGSTVTSYISASSSSSTEQHGTYLYDSASGQFVMGFMEVDYSNVSVDLLVFEGQTDGIDDVVVEAESEGRTRNCRFE